MTSKQMLKTKLPPGKWFWNIAPLGSKPNWIITDAPTPNPLDRVNTRPGGSRL
jgi:hypothetical protein